MRDLGQSAASGMRFVRDSTPRQQLWPRPKKAQGVHIALVNAHPHMETGRRAVITCFELPEGITAEDFCASRQSGTHGFERDQGALVDAQTDHGAVDDHPYEGHDP